MKTITVSKSELLGHLRTNREVHIEEYNLALIAYRNTLTSAFKIAYKKAMAGEDVPHEVNVERPLSYKNSYDTAIAQLEWHTGDVIELDQNEFKQYVLDDWHWKLAFVASTNLYKG